ncbi:MAG: fumarylacetoacetase [Candidatus Delongbacteria bacterium]|nr:fumarylacetoacetase [Candidatus Delongbacteria bacterium]
MSATTDPALKSFIAVPDGHHFPIQNLPFGVFRPRSGGNARVGTAIGDHVLDLAELQLAGCFNGPCLAGTDVFCSDALNAFMALGRPAWREARERISQLLRQDVAELRDNGSLRARVFHPAAEVEMLLPARIGDYTDFYSSREHATNVGIMFRGKENALMPNWLHLPVAYHGRASSVVVSGTAFHRPWGQIMPADSETPVHAPSRGMDIELEVGFLVGPGTRRGETVPVQSAREHIFGLVLVNDWSARDIQRWEYVPLGPFLGKNFATSISPWVVTLDALEPFVSEGPVQDPQPLEYLRTEGNPSWNIELDVLLKGAKMDHYQRICRSNFSHLYWNVNQQLAHHTVNGCDLRTGDLMASGTISGPEKSSYGSLLELAWKGTEPLSLHNGETRTYLQDGDSILITGVCRAGNAVPIGFGEVEGTLLPAHD